MAFSLVDHGPTLFPHLYPSDKEILEVSKRQWRELKENVNHCLGPILVRIFDIYQDVFLK